MTPGGEAERLGLKVGDRILFVDGDSSPKYDDLCSALQRPARPLTLRAKGVDIGEIYETPKPAWWRQAYEYVGSFFRRAPAPKRKREDDDGGPAAKKKVATLLRQADENLSAPVEDDDDDVVDLTV